MEMKHLVMLEAEVKGIYWLLFSDYREALVFAEANNIDLDKVEGLANGLARIAREYALQNG